MFENAQSAKMSDWSDTVLAAEATKAGSASEVTQKFLVIGVVYMPVEFSIIRKYIISQ